MPTVDNTSQCGTSRGAHHKYDYCPAVHNRILNDFVQIYILIIIFLSTDQAKTIYHNNMSVTLKDRLPEDDMFKDLWVTFSNSVETD